MTLILAALAAWFGRSTLGLDPASTVVVAILAALAWSAFAAVFWPFVACPAPGCDKGKLRRPGKRKAYRRCGWCGGSGERMRWGRRVYDRLRPQKRRNRGR